MEISTQLYYCGVSSRVVKIFVLVSACSEYLLETYVVRVLTIIYSDALSNTDISSTVLDAGLTILGSAMT